MSTSPYSFVAFIDEAGDEGFKILPHPDRGSSEWFVLSALVFRTREWGVQQRIISRTTAPLETKKCIHFAQLSHEKRIPVMQCIADSAGTAVSVCVHKGGFDNRKHGLDSERRLYAYTTRMLLERVSWFARDNREQGQGNGKTKLIFAHCKNLSYQKLRAYFTLLKNSDAAWKDTRISWPYLDTDKFAVHQHHDLLGLRLADAVSSGVLKALELSPQGYCEDRYVRMLKPRVYRRGGKYLSYGLKFFPSFPAVEPARDNRYGWIYETFKQEQ